MKKILFNTAVNCKPCILLVIGTLIISFSVAIGQEGNCKYREIFKADYDRALGFLCQESWIRDTLVHYGVNPDFAISVVFPELIRYSSLHDALETQGLMTLYVQYGPEYANFSVGHFQMKPTFASQLESDYQALFPGGNILPALPQSDEKEVRSARIRRLISTAWQVRYLAAYIQVTDLLFKNATGETLVEKLRFYATAYNYGYRHNELDIRNKIADRYFHTGYFNISQTYCYADIAADFFNHLTINGIYWITNKN